MAYSVQPVLAGHLSITASLLSPKVAYSVQPVLAGHLSITASLLSPKVAYSVQPVHTANNMGQAITASPDHKSSYGCSTYYTGNGISCPSSIKYSSSCSPFCELLLGVVRKGRVCEGDDERFQRHGEGGKDPTGVGGRGRHNACEHQQIVHQQLQGYNCKSSSPNPPPQHLGPAPLAATSSQGS